MDEETRKSYSFVSEHVNKKHDGVGFFCDICGEDLEKPTKFDRHSIQNHYWPHFEKHYGKQN